MPAQDGQVKRAWWAEVRASVKDTLIPLATDVANPAGTPFYCVHSITGAGGAEFGYLAEALSPHLPFHVFQVPTRERTGLNGSSLVDMATRYRQMLVPYHHALYGNTPFYLGGWSAGAIVAFEMAQQLTRLDLAPALLIAIDKAPRHTRAEIGPWNGTARNTYLWLKRSWRNSPTATAALRSLAVKFWMIAVYHQVYGGPDSVYDSKAVIDKITADAKGLDERAFIEAFYAQVIGYVPQPYPGRVLVLMTQDGYADRVAEGWRELAKQRKVMRIQGTHSSVIRGSALRTPIAKTIDLSDVRALAATLRQELVPGSRSSPVAPPSCHAVPETR